MPGSLSNVVEIATRWHKPQKQLQARKWELEALLPVRQAELASLETVASYVDDLRTLLNESSLAERKSFIRSFVKEVMGTGDEVLLTYTMPLLLAGISQETAGVLSTVQYGGPRGGWFLTPKVTVSTLPLGSTMPHVKISITSTKISRDLLSFSWRRTSRA